MHTTVSAAKFRTRIIACGLTALATLNMAACAQSQGPAAGGSAHHVASTSSESTDPSQPSLTTASQIPSGSESNSGPTSLAISPNSSTSSNLNSPIVTYEHGGLQFYDISPSYKPRLSEGSALSEFEGKGLSDYPDEGQPSVTLVLMTDYVHDRPIDADPSKPAASDVPVWLIRYQHVPTYRSGGGRMTNDTGPTLPQKPDYQDVIGVVDDSTGDALFEEISTPDRTPMSWSAPPADDLAKSSAGIETSPTIQQPSKH